MPQAKRELSPGKLRRARRLRQSSSVAEKVAWEILRSDRTGFGFRRQHAIGGYILDFYCPEAMLAVEFDGEQHDAIRDAERDRKLAGLGVMTLRIPNREFFILDEPTCDWIAELVRLCELRAGRKAWEPKRRRGPTPSPSPSGDGEGDPE